MERNCVSLETAKKLKTVGVEIESPIFGWQMFEGEWVIHSWDEIDEDSEWYIAFTAQEIADELPERSWEMFGIWQVNLKQRHYMVRLTQHLGSDEYWEEAPTMAEALAALWLKLHEATMKGEKA